MIFKHSLLSSRYCALAAIVEDRVDVDVVDAGPLPRIAFLVAAKARGSAWNL